MQAYGPHAGDAAVLAARKGPLELREVHFSYPLRQDMPGVYQFATVQVLAMYVSMVCLLCVTLAKCKLNCMHELCAM